MFKYFHLSLLLCLLALSVVAVAEEDYPLHRAAGDGLVSEVNALIRAGANVNARNKFGGTPLHSAVLNGHLPVVEILIRAGANINAPRDDGATPLHMAAAEPNNSTMIAVLLRNGANVNMQASGEKWTPLHAAAYNGNLPGVYAFIRAGANVNARDRNSDTPLHVAAEWGKPSVFTETFFARMAIVSALIGAGADVNAHREEPGGLTPDKWSGTPLHGAAFRGHIASAVVLIEGGADINARNDDGHTPLDLAKEKSHAEIINLLVQARKRK